MSRLRRLALRMVHMAGVLVLLSPAPAHPQAIRSPRRVAQGPAGQLLVTDRSGSIVAVSAVSLAPLWSFTLPDEGAPFGIAAWKRRVFVGNTTTANVEAYQLLRSPHKEMEVRFLLNLGHTPAGQAGRIEKPIALDVDPKERLVFALDGRTKTVQIFDWGGDPYGAFAPADATGEVLSPVSLAVDRKRREVLVSDYGDPSGSFRARLPARILIYDYAGKLVYQINGDRSTHITTSFARVQGLAVSASGRIYAADPLGGRVLVLDRESGALLEELGTPGSAPGELAVPLDVVLDARSGDLFVTNNQGGRPLEVFREVGGSP